MLSWIQFWSSKPHLIHLSQTLSAQSSQCSGRSVWSYTVILLKRGWKCTYLGPTQQMPVVLRVLVWLYFCDQTWTKHVLSSLHTGFSAESFKPQISLWQLPANWKRAPEWLYTFLSLLVHFSGKPGVVPITHLMLNNHKNVKAWALLPRIEGGMKEKNIEKKEELKKLFFFKKCFNT